MGFVLDFEKPIVELEKKISEMKEYSSSENVEISEEISRLEKKAMKLRNSIYAKLTRWQRVQLARHPQRPYTLDYIEHMTTDFIELHGDRGFADDPALVGGVAKLDGKHVVIFGQQKGKDTKQKLYRNFGMMHPEGYRKALRLMKLAAKFGRPVISLVDTPGAYAGIGAEERGQAEAIARNLFEMCRLPVPIIVVIIGEGASGGALGIGIGDSMLMMENTWYSVISPEGCAAILYRDAKKAPQAAEAMKVTADDVATMGVIDRIVPEPAGGAHHDPEGAASILKQIILEELAKLERVPPSDLVRRRIEKFGKMGFWQE